jgi:hypothetical protein
MRVVLTFARVIIQKMTNHICEANFFGIFVFKLNKTTTGTPIAERLPLISPEC